MLLYRDGVVDERTHDPDVTLAATGAAVRCAAPGSSLAAELAELETIRACGLACESGRGHGNLFEVVPATLACVSSDAISCDCGSSTSAMLPSKSEPSSATGCSPHALPQPLPSGRTAPAAVKDPPTDVAVPLEVRWVCRRKVPEVE